MKFLFWTGLLAAAFGLVSLILIDESEAGWAALISAINVLLATRFEAIEELSFGPLRAKLTQKVDEATETLERLRELAQLTASSILSLTKMSGRIGGYSEEEEESIRERTVDLLEKLKVAPERLEETLQDWHRFVEFDYVFYTLGGNIVPENFSDEEHAEWKKFRSGGFQNAPNPGELEAFLGRTGTLDQFRSGILEDYRYYCEHREHRRPEVWKERHNVPRLSKPK